MADDLNSADCNHPAPGWRAYLKRRMLICIFLGFSSGLPFYVLLQMLQVWVTKAGVDVKTVGLLTLATFPYTWKFLWSPLMDSIHFGRIGRRRGWMGLSQLMLFGLIGFLGTLNPLSQIQAVSIVTCLIAFVSASQDIAIDAFRRELLSDDEQGLGSTFHIQAYRIAGFVPGSLALILSDRIPWGSVFWITAAFMLPAFLCTVFVREPSGYSVRALSLRAAIVEPFREFLQRNGVGMACWTLLFIVLYKMGDSMSTAIASRFYLEQGYSATQIGSVTKVAGVWATILGAAVGGIWIIRLGINRALWIFGVIQAITIPGFILLINHGIDLPLLGLVVGAEMFGVGIGTTAYVAYIARETSPLYAATQMALLTSLSGVPRTFINSLSGYIVAALGWQNFYWLCFALSLPGMLMLLKVAPWNSRRP